MTVDRRCTIVLRQPNRSAHAIAREALCDNLDEMRWHGKHGTPPWPKEDLVYFVGAEDRFVKIGFSANLVARVCDLQGANPTPLRVLAWVRGSRDTEKAYHRQFAEDRHFGEWFHLTPPIKAEIDRINRESA